MSAQRTSEPDSHREHGAAPPRISYVSYDGAGEPLGRSQVLGYLLRLASEFEITLISFEKAPPTAELTAELVGAGITWIPLRYHRRPPVLSTVLDVLAGRRELIRAADRAGRPAIVHVRSYVPALIALAARRRIGGRLLFDIRGFWADERVEGGLWPRGGALHRIAKWWERRFFERADAVVTLTHASVGQIEAWTGGRAIPIDVIPTCVDLNRFTIRPQRQSGPHAVWSGSIGTWYRFDLAAPLADALGLPLTVITRQQDLAREQLGDHAATVLSAPPGEVGLHLHREDVGLCLIVSSFSKTASAPTRFAEYLAAGMPVIVTPGVGDLEALVEEHRVGVVLRGEDESAIAAVAAGALALAADSQTPERCRRLAEAQFDVEAGSRRYAELYARLAAS